MKLRNVNTIISREYMTRVKKKSFLLTTFLVPVLLAAVCLIPAALLAFMEDDAKKIAVIDQSEIVFPYLENQELVTYEDCSLCSVDSLKADYETQGYDALLVVSPIDTVQRTLTMSAYSSKPLSMDIEGMVERAANDAVEDYRLKYYDINNLKEILAEVESDVTLTTYTVDEDGEETETAAEVYMIISMVLAMIIYMFVVMFSGMVMQSVIEEKASRVVEVLVSSVKATELMFGKIIGVACVALTQFFLWIILTLVIVGGVTAFTGLDSLAQNPDQMTQMAGTMGVDAQMMEAAAQSGSDSAFIATLMNMDFGTIILAFVIYFVFGYLLYASLFAAIGSAVENEADTNQLQMPVTIPLMLGFFVAIYAFNAPESSMVWWCSMIPFTSPIVMLARIPYGVPTWELILSVALLAGTFIACAWISAKIYKIGILMFGKKTTFKDLWKWLRQG